MRHHSKMQVSELVLVLMALVSIVKGDDVTTFSRGQAMSPSAMYMQILQLSPHDLPTYEAQNKDIREVLRGISFRDGLMSQPVSKKLNNCTRDMEEIYNASATEIWAMKYVDSSARRPSGLLRGDLRWLGDFDECLGIPTVVTNSSVTISPRYCRLSVTIPYDRPPENILTPTTYGLTLGMCVSSSCDIDTIGDAINPQVGNFSIFIINLDQSHCFEETVPYDELAIFTITIFSILALFLLIGLAIELSILLGKWLEEKRKKSNKDEALLIEYNKDEGAASVHRSVPKDHQAPVPPPPGKWDKFIKLALCFSPYSNFTKLVSLPKQGEGADVAPNLGAINGIRALSLFWVILGHNYFFLIFLYDNLVEASGLLSRTSFLFVQAGFFAVDTFLFLSGFLAYWSMIKQIKPDRSFWLKLPFIYFHRWVRLIGPYLAVILIDLGLWAHLSSGPFYFQGLDSNCANNWWTNLLYINNLVNTMRMCVSWSWYLAVDMQLFLIAPFIVFLFNLRPRYGWLACIVALFAQVVIATSLTFSYNLPMVLTQPLTNASMAKNYREFFNIYYCKPYTRLAPQIIGIICAHLALKHAFDLSRQIFSRLWLCAVMWLLMFGIMLSLTYGPSSIYSGEYVEAQITDVFFNSFARMAWGFAIGWLVLACVFNQAGPIGGFLAWPYWALPARLSYSAYLVQPLVLIFYGQTSRRPFHSNDLNNIFLFCSVSFASLLLAIPHSLAFESPIMRLQQLLISGKSKR